MNKKVIDGIKYRKLPFNRTSVYSKYSSREQKNIADCSRRIKAHPDNSNPYFQRGRIYINTGDYAKAKEDFIKCIELNKASSASSYFYLGLAYKMSEEHELAVQNFDHAIRLEGNNFNTYYHRGESHLSLYNLTNSSEEQHILLDKALADFDKAISLNPEHFESRQQRKNAIIILSSDLIWDILQPDGPREN